jgi:hypothetical protein
MVASLQLKFQTEVSTSGKEQGFEGSRSAGSLWVNSTTSKASSRAVSPRPLAADAPIFENTSGPVAAPSKGAVRDLVWETTLSTVWADDPGLLMGGGRSEESANENCQFAIINPNAPGIHIRVLRGLRPVIIDAGEPL